MLTLIAFILVVVLSAALLPVMNRFFERDGEWRLFQDETGERESPALLQWSMGIPKAARGRS